MHLTFVVVSHAPMRPMRNMQVVAADTLPRPVTALALMLDSGG